MMNNSKNMREGRSEKESLSLRFLYHTAFGRLLLKGIFSRIWFTRIGSLWQHSRLSRMTIRGFVKKNNIDVWEWSLDEFRCFNDFFIRKKDFCDKSAANELISVADSRLSAYKIEKGLKLNIKNSHYSVESLVDNDEVAEQFYGGWCLVFRLCVDDYHRYSYLDSGKIADSYEIKGLLHTVRPIACDFNPYSTNHRMVSLLDTDNFGRVAHIEVGALMVGKIRNNHEVGYEFKKGEEKGYFEFGGSTVILLIGGDVEIDEKIVENTKNDVETRIRLGDVIGKKKM